MKKIAVTTVNLRKEGEKLALSALTVVNAARRNRNFKHYQKNNKKKIFMLTAKPIVHSPHFTPGFHISWPMFNHLNTNIASLIIDMKGSENIQASMQQTHAYNVSLNFSRLEEKQRKRCMLLHQTLIISTVARYTLTNIHKVVAQ